MASIAFDTLQFARRLKAVGVPEQQAETQAELMGEAFGFYVDDLVTRDYLDGRIDARFAEQDAKINTRFAEQDARLDDRFAQIDVRFAEVGTSFAQVNSKLRWLKWLIVTGIATALVPILQRLFA